MIGRVFSAVHADNRPEQQKPTEMLRDGSLYLFLLAGFFLFLIQSYALPVSEIAVLSVCLFSAMTFLFVWSQPRYRWFFILLLLSAFGLILWRCWDWFLNGAVLCCRTVMMQLANMISFLGEILPPEEFSPMSPIAADYFLGSLAFLYAAPLGWAVVRHRSCCLVAVLLLPWMIPAFLAELPLNWATVALLSITWIAMLLSNQAAKNSARGGLRLTGAALVIGMVLMAGFLLCFPAGEYQQPTWAESAKVQLISLGERIHEQLFSERESGLIPGGAAPSGPSEAVDLADAGPRRYTGDAVLYVESDAPGTQYLRGEAYATYTGSSWERLEEDAQEELNTSLEGWSPNLPLLFPVTFRQEAPSIALTIRYADRPSWMVYFPYQPTHTADATLESDSVLLSSEARHSYTIHYFQSSLESIPENTSTAQMEERYRQFAYQNYLEVPEETSEYLRIWRPWAERLVEHHTQNEVNSGDYQDVLAEAARIAELLAATTEYDLQTPRTQPGTDFVTYFLDVSRRGYCMHYASAAALLLRLEGIPARYVSGYLAEIPASGSAVVPDSSAHAWVEVYLDGYGWHPVEVTPPAESTEGYGEMEEAAGDTQAPEEQENPAPSQTQEAESPADAETEEGNAEQSGTPDGIPLWGVLILFTGVLLFLLLLFWLYRRYRLVCLYRKSDYTTAVIDAYGWFQQLTRWGGNIGPQVVELVQKARFSQHKLSQKEYTAVLAELQKELARCEVGQTKWKRPAFRLIFPHIEVNDFEGH